MYVDMYWAEMQDADSSYLEYIGETENEFYETE